MSRLARKPVIMPADVSLSIEKKHIKVKGPKGELAVLLLPGIEVKINGLEATVGVAPGARAADLQVRANLGTQWSILRNAVEGVSAGFSKTLEIQGVGYRAQMDGRALVLNLGYVNPVRYDGPPGANIVVEKNLITITGISKEVVGLAAAQIRLLKKPEPYKGKGIRYQGEVIKLKAGKKAATGSAK